MVSRGDQISFSAVHSTGLGKKLIALKQALWDMTPVSKRSLHSFFLNRLGNDCQLWGLCLLTYIELIYSWCVLDWILFLFISISIIFYFYFIIIFFYLYVSSESGQQPSNSWWSSCKGETWEYSSFLHPCSDFSEDEIGQMRQNKLWQILDVVKSVHLVYLVYQANCVSCLGGQNQVLMSQVSCLLYTQKDKLHRPPPAIDV